MVSTTNQALSTCAREGTCPAPDPKIESTLTSPSRSGLFASPGRVPFVAPSTVTVVEFEASVVTFVTPLSVTNVIPDLIDEVVVGAVV